MLFYFSGTGNTRWAANRLADATHERLIDICDADKTDKFVLDERERLGFCFPVHGWRPPRIMLDFIKHLVIENAVGQYCYALCTAGDNIGETISIFEKALSDKGLILDSASSLIMPESYVGLPFMDVDTLEKERMKKNMAQAHLEEYVKVVVERRLGFINLVYGHWPKLNSRVIGGLFDKYLITDKPFHIVENKCIKCGRCAKACPVHNISFEKDTLPTWNHDGSCLVCFSCYHHCPVHAIEYGRRTYKKGQYYYERNEGKAL